MSSDPLFPPHGPVWNWSADAVMTAVLGDTAGPVAYASQSPLIGPLFCGIVGSNHFRLGDDAIFILREGIAVEQVLL